MADETVVVGTVVPLTEAAKVAAKYWWIMLVAGLASLAFGIWLVTKPVKGAHTIAVVVGLYLLVVGDYEALLPHLPYRGLKKALFRAYVAFEEWALRTMVRGALTFTNGAALRAKWVK